MVAVPREKGKPHPALKTSLALLCPVPQCPLGPSHSVEMVAVPRELEKPHPALKSSLALLCPLPGPYRSVLSCSPV